MNLLTIGHAKQTLTLFKEGVPEGGGSSNSAAWVAEKKESQWLQQSRGYCTAVPSTAFKKSICKATFLSSVNLLTIGHAKQTLTLFKEGVPEGGGSSNSAAWVAEKR